MKTYRSQTAVSSLRHPSIRCHFQDDSFGLLFVSRQLEHIQRDLFLWDSIKKIFS